MAPNVEWYDTNNQDAFKLAEKIDAVVGGYEPDGSPLWVIRARHARDLLPGKLAVMHKAAWVPYYHGEHSVFNLEVCCIPASKVRWIKCRNGDVPSNAVKGGETGRGENLYVGRVQYSTSLVPGKIHPSEKKCFITWNGSELNFSDYEVLCVV